MKYFVLCSILALAAAQPAKLEVWKSASMDSMVEQTRAECAQKNDEVACMKFKVLNLLDQIFRKDNFKVMRPTLGVFCSPQVRGSLTIDRRSDCYRFRRASR